MSHNAPHKINYRDWYIPLYDDAMTLGQAYESMQLARAQQSDIPLMVQLVENPKFRVPGLEFFHGAVDLQQHDYIHIALGRGMLEKDEAFVIGFTMGSTKKVSSTEESLYGFISQHLYPKVYQFSDDDLGVFKDAVRLAHISECASLDQFDFRPFWQQPLSLLRQKLGVEMDLLVAYYKIEQKRFPEDPASKRLLDLRSTMWQLLQAS